MEHTLHLFLTIKIHSFRCYGLAVLLLFASLGKKIIISTKFDPEKACTLIDKYQVEMMTVVPIMLQRMLHNSESLKSLVCIASGGAKLNAKLVQETSEKLGSVLYNLYGTSEAGLNFIATPQDLLYSPSTIGKKIKGMQLKIVDEYNNPVKVGHVGKFYIRNSWSMSEHQHTWIDTVGLGYVDGNGYYFLSGRTDDEQYGQKLKAFVLPLEDAILIEDELRDWLRPKLARIQMPKEIQIVDKLPYTTLGKLHKKQLK